MTGEGAMIFDPLVYDYGIQPLWRKPRDRPSNPFWRVPWGERPAGPTAKRAKAKAARKANLVRMRRQQRS